MTKCEGQRACCPFWPRQRHADQALPLGVIREGVHRVHSESMPAAIDEARYENTTEVDLQMVLAIGKSLPAAGLSTEIMRAKSPAGVQSGQLGHIHDCRCSVLSGGAVQSRIL
jgi:hypothetical protein